MKIPRSELLPDLFIVPDVDNSRVEASFTAPPGCREAVCRVADGGETIAAGNVKTSPGKQARFTAEMPDFRFWDVHDPYLYEFQVELRTGGEPVEVVERFGMRKIHATPETIHVNNRPFLVRGFIRGREAHDHPNLQNLPVKEYYAKNIRAAKAYGFNLVRFHSKVPPDECFAAADELGMFIHVELRTYFGIYQKERAGLDDRGRLIDEQQWRRMILHLRNHPSLMVYCIGNEIRHPGTNPQVARIAEITRQLDPTRLFIDTCAHGEFDRDDVDIDVQHMTYFYPFGKDYDMFENTQNWLIYGSCKGAEMVQPPADQPAAGRVTRALRPSRPVLAHEVCHYVALRDLDGLAEKFDRADVDRPWWIDELRKLIERKGLAGDYPRMLSASKHFQMIGWKLGIEAARRSSLLAGFHFLQLSDTERYENSNGILDCFDAPTGVDENEFLKFNSDTVVLADLPRRTYFEGETIDVPIILSHFSPVITGQADFSFSLRSADGRSVDISGGLAGIDLVERGRREICHVHLALPETDAPHRLTLTAGLTGRDGNYQVANDWKLWVYPNRPQQVAFPPCTVVLDEINLALRYPQLRPSGSLARPEKLLIVNRFTDEVFAHLSRGGDVLMLYRVGETRDRRRPAKKERYYLPATWDRFKGVIWDRGTNLGAFIRDSEALAGFPNDGLLDLQFHRLVDDSDKIVLDDFPCRIEPIIQGVDKASRDRFDVFTFKLSELQPDWTMRRFAYLFELRAGAGRLLVTGMNFTPLESNVPECCAMFESLLRYVCSEGFRPAAGLSVDELKGYLLAKGKAARVRERMMTQYWQLNDAPLESAQYWLDAEAYIRKG